jgi:hypothetical protein
MEWDGMNKRAVYILLCGRSREKKEGGRKVDVKIGGKKDFFGRGVEGKKELVGRRREGDMQQ